MGDTATWAQERRAAIVQRVRDTMRDDDACDRLVPSDLRSLIAEIDDLRTRNDVLRQQVQRLSDEIAGH